MQQDLEAGYPDLDIKIIGINERGHEIGNESITEGRNLPWLQDLDSDGDGASDVWLNSWPVVYRDVVIVDPDNVQVTAYNVTQHDLSNPDNYAELLSLMVDAAEAESTANPWRNPSKPLDVDNDSHIVPLDVLHVLNELNSVGSYELDPSASVVPYYYDTNDDGFVTPLDALLVLNYLNDPSNLAAEGESSGAAAVSALPAGDEWDDDGDIDREHAALAPLAVDQLFDEDDHRSAVDLSLATIDEPDQPFTIHRREDTSADSLELL